MTIPQFEAPSLEEVQELLPAYEVLDLIAKGGMGAVYRARQISLDRDVAIKILPREFGADAEFREGFAAEARVMAKLNHPNLIAVYDFGEMEGMPYIVMEYVHGKALHYSAHGMAIEQTEAARLTLGICEGLAHAHRAGVLHRDIKPANILLDSKKRPKIGDFGLASVLESDGGGELPFGTPGYCAPEVEHDPDRVDQRSDVYSAGILFYELLTGELPGEPHVPASQKASVDPRFDQVIRRATHPSPRLRFSDAGEMAKELGALLDEEGRELAPAPFANGAPSIAKPVTPMFAVNRTATTGRSSVGAGVPSVPTLAVHGPGPNWPLLRNLVIIVVLIGAIIGMTRAIKRKQAANDRQSNPVEVASLVAGPDRIEPVAPRKTSPGHQGEHPAKVVPQISQTASTPPENEREAPLDALARLRRSLSAGDRTLFPPQTFSRGSSRYFFVETPMTWQDAGTFAERHGAHLATVPNDSEGDWLSSRIPSDTMVWLGGGPVGRGDWGWVDGSEWTSRTPLAKPGTNAALTKLGTIRANAGDEQHPFFIQWRMDGNNPGSLQAQLQRTRETLDSPDPLYPPGTFSFESRRYLIVARPVTWAEAAVHADKGGGHLAVPSEVLENDFLQEELRTALGDACACWIGLRRNERSFASTTGEPWTFAEWAPGFPKAHAPAGSVVRLMTGASGGWQHVAANDPAGARAFMIEWSEDHKAKNPAVTPNATGKLEALQAKSKAHITGLRKAHRKDVRDNTKWLSGELHSWLRRKPRSVSSAWTPAVDRVLEFVDDEERFQWPEGGGPVLHQDLQELVMDSIDKQKRLDDGLSVNLNKLRLSYLNKLREVRGDLLAMKLKGEAQAIDGEIAACGDGAESFHRYFTGESLPMTAAVEAGELARVPFESWLQTVRFRRPDGSQIFADGDFMAIIGVNGMRIGFRPRILGINDAEQVVFWNYNGQRASILVNPDRMTGVWTPTSGEKRQLTVIFSE